LFPLPVGKILQKALTSQFFYDISYLNINELIQPPRFGISLAYKKLSLSLQADGAMSPFAEHGWVKTWPKGHKRTGNWGQVRRT